MMLATILDGEADFADICFLVAVIAAVLAAITYAQPHWYGPVLLCVAVAAIALGLMAL